METNVEISLTNSGGKSSMSPVQFVSILWTVCCGEQKKGRSMKRQPIVWLLLALVLVLSPVAAQARYLNPNTGRFQTMDTYEGDNEDPPSLHKYVVLWGESCE